MSRLFCLPPFISTQSPPYWQFQNFSLLIMCEYFNSKISSYDTNPDSCISKYRNHIQLILQSKHFNFMQDSNNSFIFQPVFEAHMMVSDPGGHAGLVRGGWMCFDDPQACFFTWHVAGWKWVTFNKSDDRFK